MGTERWALESGERIVWRVAEDAALPHEDHVEMSGRLVSLIVRFRVGRDRRIRVERQAIWPTLRSTREDVRGYLRRTLAVEELEPQLWRGEERIPFPPVREIRFDGVWGVIYEITQGLEIQRIVFPSRTRPIVYDLFTVRDWGGAGGGFHMGLPSRNEIDLGVKGEYEVVARYELAADGSLGEITPNDFAILTLDRAELPLHFRANVKGATLAEESAVDALAARRRFIAECREALILETPDPRLDTAFAFAKVRAAESVFETQMGLVHSPGGGRYYGGVWANDQAEYSGPFFPYLGESASLDAAVNAYRIFARYMGPDYAPIPSSLEVEGDVAYTPLERGDAAMVAYGAARFALARGDREIAEELWGAIEWCLEFCRRRTNEAGVVESQSDELEGRFPTGQANLSTSSLTYGGLIAAAMLGRALGKPEGVSGEYEARAAALREAIERHFGARVEGFETYRYFEGNEVLRGWICLPLAMGITERAEGTVAALASEALWGPDGVATEAHREEFWDRSTLYALRGIFKAGRAEVGIDLLTRYTKRRLLGEHVPYPVEAHPEGGQAHLSAESALYALVFIEGLFGIEPTGLRSFRMRPAMPVDWERMALRRVQAFSGEWDLVVERGEGGLEVSLLREGEPQRQWQVGEGEAVEVVL